MSGHRWLNVSRLSQLLTSRRKRRSFYHAPHRERRRRLKRVVFHSASPSLAVRFNKILLCGDVSDGPIAEAAARFRLGLEHRLKDPRVFLSIIHSRGILVRPRKAADDAPTFPPAQSPLKGLILLAHPSNQTADLIVGLWEAYDRRGVGRFSELLWATGQLVDAAISSDRVEADSVVNALIPQLVQRGCSRFDDFSSLAEAVALYRLFPERPVSVTTDQVRMLAALKDERDRVLCARETYYRGWSEKDLHENLRQGLTFTGKEPVPAWRSPAKGEILAACEVPGGLALVEAAEGIADDNSDGAGLRRATLIRLDAATGVLTRRCELTCVLDSTHVALIDGQLLVTVREGLVSEGGDLFVESPASDWEVPFAPCKTRQGVVTVWNHPAGKQSTFRIALFDAGTCRWLEPIQGIASDMVVVGSSLVIKVHASREHELIRVDLTSGKPVQLISMGSYGPLVACPGQVFTADQVRWLVEKDRQLPGGVPSAADLKHLATSPNALVTIGVNERGEITSAAIDGEREGHAVSCLTDELSLLRQWEIDDAIVAIQALPGGRGLVVATEHTIQAVVPNRPRPITLGSWRGSARAPGILLRSSILWLVDRANDRHYGTQGYIQATSTEPDAAREEKAAEQRDPGHTIELFDFDSGTWSFVPLELGGTYFSMHLCGDRLVLLGSLEVLAFDVDKLLANAIADSSRAVRPLKKSATEETVVSGLALRGPTSEGWASHVGVERAKELLHPDDFRIWQAEADDNARFEIWQRFIAKAIERVGRWPDFFSVAAEQGRSYLALANVLDEESATSPAVLDWKIDSKSIDAVIRWKHHLEGRYASDLDADEARRLARLLLYEHCRRCATHRTLEDEIIRPWGREGAALVLKLPRAVADVFAWFNLSDLRPTRALDHARVLFGIQDKFFKLLFFPFGIALLVTVLYWSRVGEGFRLVAVGGWLACLAAWVGSMIAIRLVRKRHLKNRELDSLWNVLNLWRDGVPDMMEDPSSFMRFLRDCATEGFFAPRGRSPLQAAAARAWHHPQVNRGQIVFVSYSHRHEDLAARVVAGLKARGVAAVLDRNDLALEAPDLEVEFWIAESQTCSVNAIYLLSDDAVNSGWVRREGEWQVRLLANKNSFCLPFLVVPGGRVPGYPRSRLIDETDLRDREDAVLDALRDRLVLDWLYALRAGETNTLGVAFSGSGSPFEIYTGPKIRTLANLGRSH